ANFSVANPSWSDEQLYQAARRWNVAQMQAICYYEYLPSLGLRLPAYYHYDPEINPSIDNFFSTVSYRYGHSEVGDLLLRVDDTGKEIREGHLQLFDTFFSPSRAMTSGIEPILRGMATARQEQVDVLYAKAIQHFLFNKEGHAGGDLLTRNIQRARDHGIPDYNTCRVAFGLKRRYSFDEITSDSSVAGVLRTVYRGNIDLVDAYVGGVAEDHVGGSNLGELFYTSMLEQYLRIRDGDRFFFESPEGDLTAAEIDGLRATRLRDLILLNTDVRCLPHNLFLQQPGQDPWADASCVAGGDTGQSEESSDDSGGSGEGIRTQLLKEDYRVSWVSTDLGEGQVEANFSIEVRTEGWVGLGFEAEAGGMLEADIVMGLVDAEGRATAGDYFGLGAGRQPALDTELGGTDDVYGVAGGFDAGTGTTTLNFSRLYATGDLYDRELLTSRPTPVIFSWQADGSDDTALYHGTGTRGRAQLDLEFTEAEQPSSSPPASTEGELPPAPPLTIPTNQVDTTLKSVQLHPDFTLEWALVSEDIMLFRILTPVAGWVSIGFDPSDGGMDDCDMIMAWTGDDGQAEVTDCWSSGYGNPDPDVDVKGTEDIMGIMGTQVNGVYNYTMFRHLDTRDKRDARIEDRTQTLVFAWGTSAEWGYHGNRYGVAKINLLAETIDVDIQSTSRGMIKLHGIIMALFWSVFAPVGIAMPRFFRTWGSWLPVHRLVQIIGFTNTKVNHNSGHSLIAFFVVSTHIPATLIPQVTSRRLRKPPSSQVTSRRCSHHHPPGDLPPPAKATIVPQRGPFRACPPPPRSSASPFSPGLRLVLVKRAPPRRASFSRAVLQSVLQPGRPAEPAPPHEACAAPRHPSSVFSRDSFCVGISGFRLAMGVILGMNMRMKSLRVAHRVVGYMLMGVALYQVLTGMRKFGISETEISLYYVWVTTLAMIWVSTPTSFTRAELEGTMKSAMDGTLEDMRDEDGDDVEKTIVFPYHEFVRLVTEEDSKITIIRGRIVDLGELLGNHPGGDKMLLDIVGRDGSAEYEAHHGGDTTVYQQMKQLVVGAVASEDHDLLTRDGSSAQSKQKDGEKRLNTWQGQTLQWMESIEANYLVLAVVVLSVMITVAAFVSRSENPAYSVLDSTASAFFFVEVMSRFSLYYWVHREIRSLLADRVNCLDLGLVMIDTIMIMVDILVTNLPMGQTLSGVFKSLRGVRVFRMVRIVRSMARLKTYYQHLERRARAMKLKLNRSQWHQATLLDCTPCTMSKNTMYFQLRLNHKETFEQKITFPLHFTLRLPNGSTTAQRPYTPYKPVDQGVVSFMIKRYEGGEFTPFLFNLEPDSMIDIRVCAVPHPPPAPLACNRL
ncbi:hypothetical protein CYMTET_9400, partial [Cymbomonas tetramitiformis]